MNRRDLVKAIGTTAALAPLSALAVPAGPEPVAKMDREREAIPFEPGMVLCLKGPALIQPHSGDLELFEARTGRRISNVIRLELTIEPFGWIDAAVTVRLPNTGWGYTEVRTERQKVIVENVGMRT